ncbi:class I SAM-dependent methyltransferase [Streptomyces sp. YIM 130001]|uniref:class I SAM-dependent methyltransferase n=1 Tax=Streptomyces sp. YIM 130001 TaxID=2259644 RepID=UPI000E654F8A|nr:class I SAM-dependent methyltransferase [Streptomyces sp. YIM 130001]
MFSPQGPTLRELAVQALSSVEHGYDLLAPKFDRTPFRTPGGVLGPVTRVLRTIGPFRTGLDLCCGTGAGLEVLGEVCRDRAVGVDFSAGMLAAGRQEHRPAPGDTPADWVRGDALALPFGPVFDLVVSFGAFGHFLPEQRPRLFEQVHAVLRPGGSFAFPLVAPARPGSRGHLAMLGFDTAMRARNAVWRPPFVMYYRGFGLTDVRAELTRTGFSSALYALDELGRRPDGSPRCRLLVATRR